MNHPSPFPDDVMDFSVFNIRNDYEFLAVLLISLQIQFTSNVCYISLKMGSQYNPKTNDVTAIVLKRSA